MSSRSLIRCLDLTFENWQENVPHNELYSTISLFHLRHNTLQIIRQSTSINNELFRVYDTYVKPSSDLSKECMFLDILAQLAPVLSKKEIFLWLKTYLRPAVDSAGFDLGFVQKARHFIKSITMDIMTTDDAELTAYREEIGNDVVDSLIQISVSDSRKMFDIIGIEIPDEENDTQIHHERIRYVKHVSGIILQEYGLKKTRDYFNLLNKHFIIPEERLNVTILLSAIIGTHSSQVVQIVYTDLLENLLKCLLFDFSESVVISSMNVLVMLIPQICNEVAKLISDLFVVFLRISNWVEFERYGTNRYQLVKSFIESGEIDWKITNFDNLSDPEMFGKRQEIDYLYLGTIIYGLFPFNLSKFCQGPFKYFEKHPTRYVDTSYLASAEKDLRLASESDDTPFEFKVQEKIQLLYRSLIVHPKFINFDSQSIDEELQNPLSWIIERSTDAIGHEEITISCLSLNPDIMVHVNECMMSQDKDYNRLLNTDYDRESDSNSLARSRNSSVGGPVYFNVKDGTSQKVLLQKSLQHVNRKMSIVPTHLVVENHSLPEDDQIINFKDVKFNETADSKDDNSPNFNTFDMGMSIPSSPLLRHSSLKSMEPLHDLFSTHEALFGSKLKANSNSSTYISSIPESGSFEKRLPGIINDKLYQKTSSTPSVETSTAKGNGTSFSKLSSTTAASVKSKVGSSLDFYQREILLLKNELEFSSYLKHLNKFRYIKLKLRMNRLLREASLHFQAIEHKNNLLQIKSLQEKLTHAEEIIDKLNSELGENELVHGKRAQLLVSGLEEQEASNKELTKKIETLEHENTTINESLNRVITQVLPDKDFESAVLKDKIDDLERQINELSHENHELPEEVKSSDLDLLNQEEKMFSMKGEILFLSEKNTLLEQEVNKAQVAFDNMVTTYENKLNASKMDLNENMTRYTSQYERKIQELSAAILKYEGLLEEKNSRIMQLSSSKPISIPGTPSRISIHRPTRSSRNSTVDFHEHEIRNRSNSSIESAHTPPPAPASQPINFSHNPPPSMPSFMVSHRANSTVSQQQPIIKGRGGYQKRSKKIM